MKKKLILVNRLCPGDIVMLTAAVRDLHLAYPDQYLTDVRTTAGQLWENNPYITRIDDADPEAERIECHYPAIHYSNQRPRHFVEAYQTFLGARLGLEIPCTAFKGDVHISAQEDSWFSDIRQMTGEDIPYWIIVPGGKTDYTIKWAWPHERWQAVVDHFRDRICFIQCGEMSRGHIHRPLRGVIDMRGETDIRQFVRLMYFAQGAICPVTFTMHLAAAVKSRWGPERRPCVVINGGREPIQWVGYPNHQFMHTVGALKCCETGACWKSRSVPLGDGDAKDRVGLCVDQAGGVPRCMEMISVADVVRRVEWYFEGGACNYLTPEQAARLREKRVFEPSCRGRYDQSKWPLPARLLARDWRAGELGIGDIIQRRLGPSGEAFKRIYKKIAGHDCGCADRQAALNYRHPLK